MSSKSATFYSEIPVFRDFSKVLEVSYYYDVPKDWFILLTDVKGSTKAIEQGRYKEVNMIGAASIACVLNSLGNTEIPFVFGGDGATLIIPPESVKTISDQLKGLIRVARNDFQIELRVGLIPLQLLSDQGFNLKVAKYELSPGNCLAQFRGGALSQAEDMVKNKLPGALVLESDDGAVYPNLDGLSCRLSPLKSQKGMIISLICKPRVHNQAEPTLGEILERLKSILGENFNMASPVSINNIHWKWLSSGVSTETKMSRKDSSYLKAWLITVLKTLLANFSIKLNVPLGPFLPEKYKSELILNSDFKKFDEMLRMVVDCGPEQVAEIENLMKIYFDQKKVFYGIHKSPNALMTCMVFSASQNQHIHFIDGSQGGYAFAALELKKQIKSS